MLVGLPETMGFRLSETIKKMCVQVNVRRRFVQNDYSGVPENNKQKLAKKWWSLKLGVNGKT
jgi:hypothetical protein